MGNALEETLIIVPQIAYKIGRSARMMIKHNRMEELPHLNRFIGYYIMDDILSIRPRLLMALEREGYHTEKQKLTFILTQLYAFIQDDAFEWDDPDEDDPLESAPEENEQP